MTYRSLLVLLDQDPLCAARSQAALQLAKTLDCHLVGVAPTGLIDLPITAHAAASLTDFAALAWDTLREQAERATDHFRDACRAAGVKSCETVIDESEKAPSLVRHAQGIAEAMLSCAADLRTDLIVMGAYGHARWAERVLGGATRGLLTSMTIPVLMSH